MTVDRARLNKLLQLPPPPLPSLLVLQIKPSSMQTMGMARTGNNSNSNRGRLHCLEHSGPRLSERLQALLQLQTKLPKTHKRKRKRKQMKRKAGQRRQLSSLRMRCRASSTSKGTVPSQVALRRIRLRSLSSNSTLK